MEKKKTAFGSFVSEAGKNAAGFLGKAKENVIKAVDQNDDGEFNLDDVSAIAGVIGSAAQRTAAAVREEAGNRKLEMERKALRPIFTDDLDAVDFSMPKLIRITEPDKKHLESEICKGAIGHVFEQKDLKVVNIYRNAVEQIGLKLYPDIHGEVYYVDPSDRDQYIALDEYFYHLKVARVGELQKIAQSLGATHFKVTLTEKTEVVAEKVAKAKSGFKFPGKQSSAEAEQTVQTVEQTHAEIAAEMICPGHDPVEPQLHYLQRDAAVHSLIDLRMDKESPISHHHLTLKFSTSSGIKAKDAVKIDAALKALKLSGGTNIIDEVRKEERRFFEYEIDF